MRTLVLYYSFSGRTQQTAEQIARERGADIERVYEIRPRTALHAYTAGIIQALAGKQTAIKPLAVDIAGYERLVLAAPVWAGRPAPAFNSMAALLPADREVELVFTSGSGKGDKSGSLAEQAIRRAGCRVISYRDVKTGQ